MKRQMLLTMAVLITAMTMAQQTIVYQPMTEPQDTILAFPGAEGFGKYVSGGRGGKVVYVTNLNDSGEGSLRWAVQQYPDEPLTVLFAVTGEIALQSQLSLNRRKNFTIAGQSAPGVGIVITHNKVNFGGCENYIVRNIRFRLGQFDSNGKLLKTNAVNAENGNSFIFDHCDFGWSCEENFNTNDSHFLTVQYCIVHEGLYDAGHQKGARAYGCQWGGSPATYHHNLLVNNNKRSCRFNGAQSNDSVVYIDYINNVVYNFEGGSNGCYGGENTARLNNNDYNGLNAAHECNFINNYYKVGPNTTNKKNFIGIEYARNGATSWGPSKWYLSGNVFDGNAAGSSNNWSAVTVKTYTQADVRVDTLIRPQTPWWAWHSPTHIQGQYNFDLYAYAVGDYETADNAYSSVLDTVGCFPRDHVENRLITDTRNASSTYTCSAKKQGIIDTEEDAEGFYAYTVVSPYADTDADGMPDFWETAHGMNPAVADQNTRDAVTGYTMLEVYLDWAMHNKQPMDDGYSDLTEAENVYIHTPATRYMLQGQVMIDHEGKKYDVTGRRVE